MKIEDHILDILQLYEYAMAIGKSLDYKESCDLFLKLVLKRKNLNAAWILESRDNVLKSTYAIPLGKEIEVEKDEAKSALLDHIDFAQIVSSGNEISTMAPIAIDGGITAIFNLQDGGYLFLYSKKDNLTKKDVLQLEPVISKFTINLKACKAFKEQEQLLNNLEVQNKELSDYAHMVSHDLKSPLRSIDSLATWLKEDYDAKLDDKGKESLGLIRSSVDKMDALINGILEYSTIGKNKVEVYDVDTNKLIDDISESLHVPSHFSIIKRNLPVIRGDKYRLQQLFQNLITNALNYNDKEKGIIEIGVQEKNHFWQFYVKDNGKGIEKKYFDKIFNTFEKLENNLESTGIGLSIAKKIVDIYGGNIWLTSKVSEGTTFFFTIKK
ncbi:hypothetical protein BWZ20_07095 [Winogradskyella sp. J14-2]|uniref:sensor histidine kinase n=1 Tax=Winogradskyella sp. J14-2 TaxID=1936080 RepID=UPI000972AB64|nr:ATP-binding protein [Winogradskyella sp. J14-2]APY08078.1 hypothetical protein BWZ20_07095 [Winogradskyella sp. J14-2]